ncbi:MAG: hypothetical protein INR73_10995 [Williamsia sp.]|nr:hypothetical protein [Williamsia sp.]
MKKLIFLFTLATTVASTACEKDSVSSVPDNLPRTTVPAEMRGTWMYGKFSTTEYWSTDPGTYIGNALQFAIAFQFEENGTYTHYFTASSVVAGVVTYQQSVTKGTLEIDAVGKLIKMHPYSSHYKRTQGGKTVEERDMTKQELSTNNSYSYTAGTEPGGTKALYLTISGTSSTLSFLKK